MKSLSNISVLFGYSHSVLLTWFCLASECTAALVYSKFEACSSRSHRRVQYKPDFMLESLHCSCAVCCWTPNLSAVFVTVANSSPVSAGAASSFIRPSRCSLVQGTTHCTCEPGFTISGQDRSICTGAITANTLHSCGRPHLNWYPKHSPQLWKTPSELISQTLSTAVEVPRWTDIPNTLHSCGRPPLNWYPKHSPQLWKTPAQQTSQTLSTAVEDPRWTDIPNTLHSCGRPPLNRYPKHSPQLWKTPAEQISQTLSTAVEDPPEQISQTLSTAVEDPLWTDIPNTLHSCGRPPLNRCSKHSPQLWKTPAELISQTLSTAVEDPRWTDVPNTLHSCGRPPLNRYPKHSPQLWKTPLNRYPKHSPQLWKTPSEQISQTVSTAVEDPLNLDV